MDAHVELVIGLVVAALPLLTILAIVWITRLAGRPSRQLPLRAGAPPLAEQSRPTWPAAPARTAELPQPQPPPTPRRS